jgi:hypothetical protein
VEFACERHGNSTGVSSCRIKLLLEQIHSVASSNENRAVEVLRTRSDMLTEDRWAEILASVEKQKEMEKTQEELDEHTAVAWLLEQPEEASVLS